MYRHTQQRGVAEFSHLIAKRTGLDESVSPEQRAGLDVPGSDQRIVKKALEFGHG